MSPAMKMVSLTVNAQPVTALAEPRQSLADFVRGPLGLTGTHLGCEQGVCGACTVVIDGKPSRACITYAVACEGADIVTIEGFDDDEVMGALRKNFSEKHALQCGFCTPGMLVASRDLILRRGEVDEGAIREELSGNICRCTGYMGIVAAVKAASAGRSPQPAALAAKPETLAKDAAPAAATLGPSATAAARPVEEVAASADGWTEVKQTIDIAVAPDTVWAVLRDVRRVAACLPGAQIDAIEGDKVDGRMVVKFGPIRASFSGGATTAFDDAARTGRVRGSGRDAGSNSQAMGEVSFAVVPRGTAASAIDIALRYRVTGPLAQFSRAALVRDFVATMTDNFAGNLAAALKNPDAAPAQAKELSALGLAWAVLKRRVQGMLGG